MSLPTGAGGVVLVLAPGEPAVELAGIRALVADDNATIRLILRRRLTPYGAAVTEVDGGEAGLAALRTARLADAPTLLRALLKGVSLLMRRCRRGRPSVH